MIMGQGAVPVIRNGVVEGACGVSGGTAQQDEDCAGTGVSRSCRSSSERSSPGATERSDKDECGRGPAMRWFEDKRRVAPGRDRFRPGDDARMAAPAGATPRIP